MKTIELGVQSANDYILGKANRGHTFKDVEKASKMIRRHHFKLGHQMTLITSIFLFANNLTNCLQVSIAFGNGTGS